MKREPVFTPIDLRSWKRGPMFIISQRWRLRAIR